MPVKTEIYRRLRADIIACLYLKKTLLGRIVSEPIHRISLPAYEVKS